MQTCKKLTILEENEIVSLHELSTGNLAIHLLDSQKLINTLGSHHSYPDSIFIDIFEDIQCNSAMDYHPDLGERGFGLTNAPGITLDFHYDDNGDYTDKPHGEGKAWFYPDYMIKSFIMELLYSSVCIFEKVG